MSSETISIIGELWGQRCTQDTGAVTGEIVRSVANHRPAGPADNAMLLVEIGVDGTRRCRYIAWINHYDIEHAERQQPSMWRVIDPPLDYHAESRWLPYGWGGDSLPSVADTRPHT